MILLAEDSENDAVLFKETLKRAGVWNRVMVVRDGEETMAYLKGEGKFSNREEYPFPRIVFLDLTMPKVNGWEVLDWVKSNPRLDDLFMVVLTGGNQLSEMRRAYQAGARSFLVKPCRVQDLENLAGLYPHYWDRRLGGRG